MFCPGIDRSRSRRGDEGLRAANTSWPRSESAFAKSARWISPPPMSRAEQICRMRIAAQNLTQLLELRSLRVVQASNAIHRMASNDQRRNCLICKRELRYVGSDFAGKEIYKCRECGYVMTPVASDDDATELYDDPDYFDGWGCNLEFDYERFEPT